MGFAFGMNHGELSKHEFHKAIRSREGIMSQPWEGVKHKFGLVQKSQNHITSAFSFPTSDKFLRGHARKKYHIDAGGIDDETGWQIRPGLRTRELYQDRDGYRVAILMYAEGAIESERILSIDEHQFILAGSLYDASGVYGPGSYILNPTGMRSKFWTPSGCLSIIHRLPPNEDALPIDINRSWTAATEIMQEAKDKNLAFQVGVGWGELRPGVFILPLFEGPPANFKSALLRYFPGSSIPEHIHTGDEHIYILEGSQEDETGSYSEGSYVFNPAGTMHRVWSDEGCLALIHWRAPMQYLQDPNRW